MLKNEFEKRAKDLLKKSESAKKQGYEIYQKYKNSEEEIPEDEQTKLNKSENLFKMYAGDLCSLVADYLKQPCSTIKKCYPYKQDQ